jgi:hypothetical protein
VSTRHGWLRWGALVFALLLLNASLAFQNVWPTPAIRWRGALSAELAVFVLASAVARGWTGAPSRAALRWLGVAWVLLVLGRYGYVTAPAMFGRDINLYFDLRFLPDVTAMFTRVAPAWLVALVAAATVVGLLVVYGLLRWALGRLGDALSHTGERRVLGTIAAGAVLLFVGQQVSQRVPSVPAFSVPVTQAYVEQVRLMVRAMVRARALPPSPPMQTDLANVKGADVFLVFLESYGAVAYERPELASRLIAGLAELEAAVRLTNRAAVSAFVESSTFGGSSWLAHVSLLSGVEVRDLGMSHSLMMQRRDTLVSTFGRHGYRTVALMPGQRDRWPEGTFYGFDDIYGVARLDYRGPEFGWFAVPDQFALAQLDALEAARPVRAPLFVFFPTLSAHTPFVPVAPYQPDWPRMLTDQPYEKTTVERALAREPEWLNLGVSYTEAMAYVLTTLGGYLRAHAERDFVMLLIGDHQPPSVVSGEGAPWTVPVHVITSRQPILDRLEQRGFRPGLTPSRPSLGALSALLPVLLDAFGDPERNGLPE